MNRWAIVAIPLMVCLVLMDAVVRQFAADRAFSQPKDRVIELEKQSISTASEKTHRPESLPLVESLLRKAVKLEPRCAEYRHYLGRYYNHVADDPNAPEDRTARAVQRALEEYKKAVHFDPLNGEYLARLAYLQGALGQHEEAVANFKKAMALDRSNEWIREVYEVYRRSRLPEAENPDRPE